MSKRTLFYAAWITRNGQHLWSGPFWSRRAAQHVLDHTMECTGHRILAEVTEAS